MSLSLRPILIHTALQAGIGVLAARFYNGQTPISKLFFGEAPAPIPLLTGAVFGASSALFFRLSSRLFARLHPDEDEGLDRRRIALNKIRKYVFILYLGTLAASRYTSVCGFPLSFRASLILSVAMMGAAVEIILASVVAASPILVGLGCYYGLRWIRR